MLKNSDISVKYIRATLSGVMTYCFIFRTLAGNRNYCTSVNMTVQVSCYWQDRRITGWTSCNACCC